ncbi:CHAT domain-containing protein [Leptothoe spongobia]|uniref:CHAT domain-containing protein n=1 Tax=Leptothoe spongobia TAU-MAC 1115 TaxID=1967444 RepID=A0A947GJL7_9CYAN|nr:CHAT domain-containing protein [Leptothoe spongobia]MBT9315777.1 CHAT domain-containing protein [Leptothoe spongobia TAU-MAC 1115]
MKHPLRALLLFVLSLCLILIGLPALSQPQPQPLLVDKSSEISVAATSTSLLEQGQHFYQQGQYENAIATWQTALDTPTIHASEQAAIWAYLALAYQKTGQWEAGERAITNSLASLDRLPQNSERARLMAQTLNAQGQLAFTQGRTETALQAWQQTTQIYQDLDYQPGITGSLINQSRALETIGHYRRACQSLLNAINLTEQSCDFSHSDTAPNKIIQAFEQESDNTLKILGLRSLGNVMRLTGQLPEAQQLLKQSVTLANSQEKPHQKLLSLLSLGKTEQALYEQAAYRYSQTSLPRDEAALKTHAENALAHYINTQEIAQALVKEHPDLFSQTVIQQFTLLVNLHLGQFSQGLFPQLRLQLQTQLLTVKRLPSLAPNRTNLYTQINLAKSYIALQKSPETTIRPSATEIFDLLSQVQQQAVAINDTDAQSYALGTLGGLYEQSAKQPHSDAKLLQQAQILTTKALELAQSTDHIAYQWQWQLGRIYAAQQSTDQAINYYQAAADSLQTLRQDLVAIESGAQFSFRDTVEPLYRELVALRLNQTKASIPSQDNLLQAIKDIDALQLTELENFLSCNLTQTIALSEPQVDTSTAIIYPIILSDQVAVIVRLPQSDELQFHSVSIPKTEVGQILTQLRQQTENRYRSTIFLERSGQVYDWLIRPFETVLTQQQIHTLVFVSDGALRNVPMAVLYNGERFLIEDYSIALSPGLQLPASKPLSQIQLDAIAFGLSDIRPDFEPHKGFAPLTNVETELAAIKTQVPSRQFLNQDFTTPNLQTLGDSDRSPVVHLATHGQFSSDPNETFLLAWDQRITLNDFGQILQNQTTSDTTNIELLILSACKTASGDNRATLGLAGVAIQAGARSTIASLWFVDDQSTAALMTRLYEILGNPTKQLTRAEVLRQAQLDLLHTPGYQGPFYWAPYVLVGNWS